MKREIRQPDDPFRHRSATPPSVPPPPARFTSPAKISRSRPALGKVACWSLP